MEEYYEYKKSMITDISAELEKEFGAPGTPERAKFRMKKHTLFIPDKYCRQKEAKVTQLELAKRINAIQVLHFPY